MPVELTWDGKYVNGKKTAPVRIALPFQDVETVNESVHERTLMLDLWGTQRQTEWRNRLIWGDKKYVLPSLLPEFAGKVNLIYIDPPFATGADFSFTATIPTADDDTGGGNATFVKQPNVIEQKAYRDTWGRGLDSYLQWFYETAVLLHELLAENGSLYVHLDYHIGHYAKVVLDEVFGQENLRNEIIWKRSLPHNDPNKYGAIHDIILFYVKSENYIFNQQYTGISDEYMKSHYSQVDDRGRKYQLTSLAAKGPGPARRFGNKLLEPPKGTHWRYSQKNIDELMAEGRIVFTSEGTPRYIRYMDEMKGPALQSIWTDLNPVNSQAIERLDYPTQKPEALLERIIQASSNEGDLVLDCFCVRKGTLVWTVTQTPLNPPAGGGKETQTGSQETQVAPPSPSPLAPSPSTGRVGVGSPGLPIDTHPLPVQSDNDTPLVPPQAGGERRRQAAKRHRSLHRLLPLWPPPRLRGGLGWGLLACPSTHIHSPSRATMTPPLIPPHTGERDEDRQPRDTGRPTVSFPSGPLPVYGEGWGGVSPHPY